MNIRQLIKEAQKQGFKIEYDNRKGGGVDITKINGVKYNKRTHSGNKELRKILNKPLTNRQTEHIKQIKPHKMFGGRRKSNKTTEILDDEAKKLLKKAQRRIRRYTQQDEKHARLTTIKKKSVEYNIKTYGLEEAKRRLKEIYYYTKGIAYDGNIYSLVERLNSFSNKVESIFERGVDTTPLSVAALKINSFIGKYKFKDEWIPEINNELYNAENLIEQYLNESYSNDNIEVQTIIDDLAAYINSVINQ